MTSPFLPCSFTYGDSPQGGAVMPMVVTGRDPNNSSDKNYAAGYTWLSSLDMSVNGVAGTGNLFVQSGNSAGLPNWTAVTAGATGALNTLSDGITTVTPLLGNIAILGTANQINTVGSIASHNITFSLPSNVIFPGSAQTTTTFTVGTNLTVNGTITVTGAETFSGNVTIGGTLGVTGLTTLAALTVVGTTLINASGAAATTIATGGTGTLALGNAVGNTALTGSFSTLTDAATFVIGTAGQTGTTTIVSSTAANSVLIQDGINVGAQITSINNGATAANSTVNILSGVGTAGVGVLLLGNNRRVTTVDIANVAPSAARVITIAGGAQAQNDTVTIFGGAASAGTQTFNLFSGNSAGATQNINIATGTGAFGINIGTGATGVKTIAIGGTAANVITIANTQTAGSFAVGALMTTGTIAFGGANMTGLITLGAAANVTGQTINISSAATITGPNVVNVLAGATPAANQTLNVMTGVGTTGTYAVNILTGNSTGTTQTVSVGTGSARTDITLGGTGANVIAIANTQIAGSFAVGNLMTTGTIALGGTAMTGLITIGQATNATGQTVNVLSGASIAGANILNLLAGATPAASQTVNIMTGIGSAGTYTLNVLTGASTGTTQAINIANSTAVTTLQIANGAAANVVTLGSTTASASLTLQAGSGTTGLKLATGTTNATAGNIQMAPSIISAAALTVVNNARVGQAVFTGQTTASGATDTYTITNSTISGTTQAILMTCDNLGTNDAQMTITRIKQSAGSIAVQIKNNGAAALNGDLHLTFWILN